MFRFYLLIIVLFFDFNFVKSSCDPKNAKAHLEPLPKIDYYGRSLYSVFYPIQTSLLKFFPQKKEICQTQPLLLNDIVFRMSIRPRGCCAECCIIDNVDKFVEIKVVHKDAKDDVIPMSSQKQKGKLEALGVKKQLPTILYIHGYGETGLNNFGGQLLTSAYLKREEDYNLLQVGWGELSSFPWYIEAKENTKLVAKSVAEFLQFYHDTGELPIENLHIIGFSLGAHVAGHVGKTFKNTQKIPRITGLDPAFPLYSLTDKTDRLCEEDADFVDVIHTDTHVFGIPVSIGHADFYPHRDEMFQPGCDSLTLLRKANLVLFIFCNHIRSQQLYAESILNPRAFPMFVNGTQSQKWDTSQDAFMGVLANKRTTMGDYYLTTNDKSPYGRSEY